MGTAIPGEPADLGKADVMEWPDELAVLYERTYRDHVQLVYAMIGSRHEAEEIVQDAVLELGRRWPEVDHPGPYLRRTVVNGAIGVLRHRRVVERHQIDPPPPDEPQHLVELRDCLLRLPERQRAAVLLRYVAGLDDKEIASILGCRRATVRSLVARGLASLRSEIPK